MRKNVLSIIFILFAISGVKGQEGIPFGPKEKVYINYEFTEKANNVDPSDAIDLLTDYLKDKTSLVIVDSLHKANFSIDLKMIKGGMDTRKGYIVIKEAKTNEIIFHSKEVKGASTAFSGYSASRQVMRSIIKELLKKYPTIIW